VTDPPGDGQLAVDADSSPEQVAAAARAWVAANVPSEWREAAERGGLTALRAVRPRAVYERWYPTFARSGMVVPTWPRRYLGLDLGQRAARALEEELRPYHLGRLNPLGLSLAGPTLLACGSEEQRERYLRPIVLDEERWCQLFSEPGAGSDLASLATRAERDGDDWVVHGQKVWSTFAHEAAFGLLLARTDPDVTKRAGITAFVCPMRADGVTVRPLRQITGDAEFNETFLDAVRIPDSWRIGGVGEGWKVANATLSGERSMGAGSGGIERLGGRSVERLIAVARERAASGMGGWSDPLVRQRLVALWAGEKVLIWTNTRARDLRRSGRPPGPEASIGKLLSAEHNLALQEAWIDLVGMRAMARDGDDGDARSIAYGFLRSRANTIEGGTAQIQRNILGERVLGLPREPDPWLDAPWRDVPKS